VKVRGKLVLAQVPLAVALAFVGVVSSAVTVRLGQQARLVLADNYRSVLAAERMKEALERVDRGALLRLAGREDGPVAQMAASRARFEEELAAQEGNITEAGEADVTRALRAAWDGLAAEVIRYEALRERAARDAKYFGALQPAYAEVHRLADQLLAINQDAMVRKVERAEQSARQLERLVFTAVLAALIVGFLASAWLTSRLLRPLGVVAAAVRRFGKDDLRARAAVRGRDEIADVAAEFNRMADGLERYRASSLGELLQAQQAAQAAIDSLPDPVLLLDAAGKLGGVNAATARLLGVDVSASANVDDAFVAADPGVRAVVDRLRAHVLGGKGPYVPKGFEEAVRVPATPDGERILMPRAVPIYNEGGGVAGAAIVLQDATRLYRFDQLKNDLVATVAHELRTPLTSLRMALHLCTEGVVGPLSPKQADLLFAARDDCERLQVIVDELLNLSRIESGQIELHRRRVDPESLVASAADVHQAAARQAEVTLVTEVPPGLPDVFVDADRVALVFGNLVTNALRFAPPGSRILLRAEAEAGEAGPAGARDHRVALPGAVRFTVEDQGPGIAPEHQAGLFEKFFRVPGSPTGGSGLGLFIAKGIVQAHEGRIGVGSAPGRTTFWFTVPAAALHSGP
jgi:signal transduction histidine kinase